MKNKIIKTILALVALLISPMVVLAVLGSIFIIVKVIGGVSFADGYHLLISLINKMIPYTPYLTTIPMIAVGIAFITQKLMKRRKA